MSGGGKRDQEERATDALLVSALRLEDKDQDDLGTKHLPELTEEERAATKSLGRDFIQRLLRGEKPIQTPASESAGDDIDPENAGLGDASEAESRASFALNRAEEIDEETAEELARKRREILERKKQAEREGGEE